MNLAIADEYDDSEQGETYRLAKLLGLGHLESSESHQGISRVGILRSPEKRNVSVKCVFDAIELGSSDDNNALQ